MSSSPLSNLFTSKLAAKKKFKQSSKTKRKYRTYNGLYLAAALTPMLLAGAFNWIVDPYDVFNTPNWLGINHEKPKKDNNDRLFKATDVIRIKPTTIILGSSRTKQGINPDHSVFSDSPSVYNLAINGPNAYEVRRYLEHAIKVQPNLEQVVLGIDFFMFNANLENQPSFAENRLGTRHIALGDAVNALFSIDTLDASQKTIAASLDAPNQQDNYGENGFMPNRNADDGNTDWRFEESIKLYYSLHSDYQLSEQYLEEFRKIVELCQQNNINLVVFISPAHATQWEAIYATGRWQTFERWKQQIVNITPVWDFSGFNSITTEPIGAKMQNYVDNSHYTPNVGNLILQRLFGQQTENIPEDFGVFLTPDNIEDYLEKTRNEHQNWREKQSDDLNLVYQLKNK